MYNRNKVLVICGPTATGKTKLAICLAKKYDGELISADSRQVYKGMDIGTGKDIALGSKPIKDGDYQYYLINGVKVWGYDLVDPRDEFSVSEYLKTMHPILLSVLSRKKLPIIVGGTGLYIRALIDGIATVNIPKDDNLRQSLINKTKSDLYERLAQMDPIKAGSMNFSDRNNPRRLIRAIEIAQWNIKNKKIKNNNIRKEAFNLMFIGLLAQKDLLSDLIKKRSENMIEEGLIGEIKNLLVLGVKWDRQPFNTIGYAEWKNYLNTGIKNKKLFEDTKKKWVDNQVNYVKRQMTWFNKDKRIFWLDINKSNYESSAINLVRNWLSKDGKKSKAKLMKK